MIDDLLASSKDATIEGHRAQFCERHEWYEHGPFTRQRETKHSLCGPLQRDAIKKAGRLDPTHDYVTRVAS
ncbi:hypothetical protein M404DRAFT_36218 [Pisolithus tinctorius Marx 270]|uniref:Uncharacterized protein n=1 Tax=Pisolithus tinctorius Marx 270 TaxID=870435 RepID=A0A0C3NBR9_PISTI|nr:hypothetical protein M404DRAFT_36218 [Pisolithus tinctorius Marx 270]